MKKKSFTLIIIALLIVSLLAGCGGMGKTAANDAAAVAPGYRAEADYDVGYTGNSMTYTSDGSIPKDKVILDSAESEYSSDLSDVIASAAKTSNSETEKIIYTAYADIETLTFDDTVAEVYTLMERFGAYIESSSVTGEDYHTSYYGGKAYRNAHFTIRVPVQNYTDMSSSLTTLGNVTRFSSDSQNITSQFVDTESRLKAYKTEYDRLLEMMAASKTIEEMIAVEARLSEVEYQIETLTGTLRDWQARVDYSTINLNINEVYTITVKEPVPVTFGDEIRDAVRNSIDWLVRAGKDIVIFLLAAIPVLIIPAVLVILLILWIRSARKKKAAKRLAAWQAAQAAQSPVKNDETTDSK